MSITVKNISHTVVYIPTKEGIDRPLFSNDKEIVEDSERIQQLIASGRLRVEPKKELSGDTSKVTPDPTPSPEPPLVEDATVGIEPVVASDVEAPQNNKRGTSRG